MLIFYFVADIYVIACFACLYNRDFFHGYMIAKDLLLRHVQNHEVWNIYSLMLHMVEDTRNCYRFIGNLYISFTFTT